MDSRELRLGNYVGLSTNGTSLKTFHAGLETYEVISISQTYVSLKGVDYPLSENHGRSSAKPIPLTEEWLIRVGFSLEYKSTMHSTYELMRGKFTYYFWHTDKRQYLNFNGTCIVCNHIHTLQNIVHALTGEELTIKSN